MSIILPSVRPTMALDLPEPGGYTEVSMTTGQLLSTGPTSGLPEPFIVGSDADGRYITLLLDNPSPLNLSTYGDFPDLQPDAQVAYGRMRVWMETPAYVGPQYGHSSRVNMSSNPADITLVAERGPAGDPSYSLSVGGTGVQREEIPMEGMYREVRWRAEVGQPLEWQALDLLEGFGEGISGVGTEPVTELFSPAWVWTLNLSVDPAWMNPAPPRLYRADVWIDPQLPRGFPPLRQRQSALNSGGPPLRHRQSGGQTGGPPLRHRQNGI